MLIWLHRHYFVVWLVWFAVLFLLLGGWVALQKFGWISTRHAAGDIFPLQIMAIQLVVSFIDACIMCGITGFTYSEDPDYYYPASYYENR